MFLFLQSHPTNGSVPRRTQGLYVLIIFPLLGHWVTWHLCTNQSYQISSFLLGCYLRLAVGKIFPFWLWTSTTFYSPSWATKVKGLMTLAIIYSSQSFALTWERWVLYFHNAALVQARISSQGKCELELVGEALAAGLTCLHKDRTQPLIKTATSYWLLLEGSPEFSIEIAFES